MPGRIIIQLSLILLSRETLPWIILALYLLLRSEGILTLMWRKAVEFSLTANFA